MRVLAYVHAYVPNHNGGAETTLHDMLSSLKKAGHEVLVVVKESPYRKPGEYEVEGIRVINSEDKVTISRHVGEYDLILSHLQCSERATHLAQYFNIPSAHLIHNNMELTKENVSQGPSFLIYNSDWIKEDFAPRYAHVPSIVVHPPIWQDRYKTERGKKITLVNLFERKGHDIFYKLAERMPDIEFLAVKGGYGDQIIQDNLPNVEFMENTFNVKEVYAKTKVILMPSVYESYGRVACEAAASGIPSIVSPTPGLKEALGDAAIYADRGDVNGWETALRSLLTPRRYGAMSKLALARSNALQAKAEKELADFVLYCEQFVSEYKRKRGF